ncbi:MAG: MFS transporter, partial [Burkholderiaceae bacterium]
MTAPVAACRRGFSMPLFDSDPAGAAGPGRAAWLAIALALLGRWVHAFAQAWLMFSLTGSMLWLAAATAVAALSALPVAFLSGTCLAQRSPWRRLVFAHAGLIAVALACAVCLFGQRLAPWQLLLAAAAYGGLAAVEAPALAAVVGVAESAGGRQAGAARHALLFNGMRVLAPTLAAALIAVAGAAACFVFNAVCLLPMLRLAWRARSRPVLPDALSPTASVEPLHGPVRWLANAAVFSALVLPVAALLPAISHAIGGDSLALLSRLSSGLGAGALGAALLLCRWRPVAAVRGSQALAGLALLAAPGLASPALQLAWSVLLG